MIFCFESGLRIEVSSPGQVGELIDQLEQYDSSFFILEAPDKSFLQAATKGTGFVLEKQDGDIERYYRAQASDGGDVLPIEEVKRAAAAKVDGSLSDLDLSWQKVDVANEAAAPKDQSYFVNLYGDNFVSRMMWFNERMDHWRWQFAKVAAIGLIIFIAYKILSA